MVQTQSRDKAKPLVSQRQGWVGTTPPFRSLLRSGSATGRAAHWTEPRVFGGNGDSSGVFFLLLQAIVPVHTPFIRLTPTRLRRNVPCIRWGHFANVKCKTSGENCRPISTPRPKWREKIVKRRQDVLVCSAPLASDGHQGQGAI